MKLREYLETAPNDRILYIGSGSGFLVAGLKDKGYEYGGVRYLPIMDQLKAQNEKRRVKYDENRQKCIDFYKKAVAESGEESKRAILAKGCIPEPFIDFFDREVIQTWDRQEEDALNIQIKGDECGSIWTIHESDPLELNYNCEQLVGAALRKVCQDYASEFRIELQTMKELLDKLKTYADQSRGYERYIRYLCGSDVYVDDKGRRHKFPNRIFAISNPEMLITMVRTSVAETLMEEEAKEAKRRNKENK